jgi:hypothetical protein
MAETSNGYAQDRRVSLVAKTSGLRAGREQSADNLSDGGGPKACNR